MAWMRMMGADSVAYHRDTVLNRADDHPGQALAYYASRGETPLEWGGAGARALGLVGTVTEAQYEAVYGPGGAVDPTTGERLVNTRRPGMELVIAAHKSVAELGVIGRAEDMHRILDAERNATLAYLDDLVRLRGGRRGAASVATPTAGLTYAVTRHATPRPGRATLLRMTTCSSPTSSAWTTTVAAGRPPTCPCPETTCMPPPWSAGWPRPGRPCGWVTASFPTTARRVAWASGPSPALPRKPWRSTRNGRPRSPPRRSVGASPATGPATSWPAITGRPSATSRWPT